MAISKVTPLPTAMSRQRPENYSAEGDVYFSALEQKMVPELNATVDGINIAAAVVDQQCTAALIAAQNAASAQATASVTANAQVWVRGATYQINAVVVSQVNFQTYRKRTSSSSSTTDPANDSTNWVLVGIGVLPYELRSGLGSFSSIDCGKLIDVNSGTFTQTFPSPSELGSGWYVFYRNSGAGVITVGLTKLYPGWFGILQCDGVSSEIKVITIQPPTGYMKVSERYASGSVPNMSTGLGTRVLNTVESNSIVGASLLNNTITLPAGAYQVRGHTPLIGGQNRAFLFNVTDGAFALLGSNGGSSMNSTYFSDSSVVGTFTINSAKNFVLMQQAGSHFGGPSAVQGGYPYANGDAEVYAELEIWKVA